MFVCIREALSENNFCLLQKDYKKIKLKEQ